MCGTVCPGERETFLNGCMMSRKKILQDEDKCLPRREPPETPNDDSTAVTESIRVGDADPSVDKLLVRKKNKLVGELPQP